MKLSELSPQYLFAMVQSMHAYECTLFNRETILQEWEEQEFYMAYMGKDTHA